MTDHYDYTVMLSALVDGELDDDERAELLDHVRTCESCREELAQLMLMHDALEDAGEYEPPAGFAAGIVARLHEDELSMLRTQAHSAATKRPNTHKRWYALAACAAAVVLLVTVVPQALRMGSKNATATEDLQSSALYYDATGLEAEGQPPAEYAVPVAPEMPADALTEAKTAVSAEPSEPTAAANGAEDRRAYIVLGDDAEAYLARVGAPDADMGAYAVLAGQLKKLPDGLSLSPEDAWYLSFQSDDAVVFAVVAPTAPAEAADTAGSLEPVEAPAPVETEAAP